MFKLFGCVNELMLLLKLEVILELGDVEVIYPVFLGGSRFLHFARRF